MGLFKDIGNFAERHPIFTLLVLSGRSRAYDDRQWPAPYAPTPKPIPVYQVDPPEQPVAPSKDEHSPFYLPPPKLDIQLDPVTGDLISVFDPVTRRLTDVVPVDRTLPPEVEAAVNAWYYEGLEWQKEQEEKAKTGPPAGQIIDDFRDLLDFHPRLVRVLVLIGAGFLWFWIFGFK